MSSLWIPSGWTEYGRNLKEKHEKQEFWKARSSICVEDSYSFPACYTVVSFDGNFVANYIIKLQAYLWGDDSINGHVGDICEHHALP